MLLLILYQQKSTHECTWNLRIEILTLIPEEEIEDDIGQLGILRESVSDKSEKWQDLTLGKVGQKINMQVSHFLTFFYRKDRRYLT